jgi:hypothetical protein
MKSEITTNQALKLAKKFNYNVELIDYQTW